MQKVMSKNATHSHEMQQESIGVFLVKLVDRYFKSKK